MSLTPGDDCVALTYSAHWVFDAKHEEDLKAAGDDPALISLVNHQANMRQYLAAKEQLEGKKITIGYALDVQGKYIGGTFMVCEVFPEMSMKRSFFTMFAYPMAPGAVRLTRLHVIRATTIMFS
ncbi:MAG TPA: hypothetical protein VJ579_02295 [Candidatus Paceibacterota bacterium]|nr:hypothetical protein [Candidatus Paceibacterota bacterium]